MYSSDRHDSGVPGVHRVVYTGWYTPGGIPGTYREVYTTQGGIPGYIHRYTPPREAYQAIYTLWYTHHVYQAIYTLWYTHHVHPGYTSGYTSLCVLETSAQSGPSLPKEWRECCAKWSLFLPECERMLRKVVPLSP